MTKKQFIKKLRELADDNELKIAVDERMQDHVCDSYSIVQWNKLMNDRKNGILAEIVLKMLADELEARGMADAVDLPFV